MINRKQINQYNYFTLISQAKLLNICWFQELKCLELQLLYVIPNSMKSLWIFNSCLE